MNKKLLITGLFAISILLFFFACQSSGNKIVNPEFGRYISAFTSGNIHNKSDITIQLTQPLPYVEIGKKIDEKLFKFSPSIKGEASWVNASTIVFTPEEGALKTDTHYDAWFNLGKVMNVDENFSEFYFDFTVPEQNFSLYLDNYRPIQKKDLAWNSVSGLLELSNDANLEDINKMFSISGKMSEKTIITVGPTEQLGVYSVKIDSLYRSETETNIYKLKVNGKSIKSKQDETFEVILPSLPEFDVINAEILYEPEQHVKIVFSDPLSDKQNIKGLISVNYGTNYSFEVEDNVVKLYLDVEAGNQIELKVHKELKNSMEKPLGKDKQYSLTFEKLNPQVKLVTKGSILPNTNKLFIPFQAVNLRAVDVTIIKVFENNILHYMQVNDMGDNNELKRFGRLIAKKRIRLDKDPSVKLDRWNTFPLDLSELIKKDPGAIYKIEFTIKQEYSIYPCDQSEEANSQSNLSKFDNTITEDEMSYWDNPDYYYYDDDYDWDVYSWKDRDNPCTPSYYMNKKVSTFALSSNIGITAKQGNANNVFVALNNILTTQPLTGAEVEIYNYQMQVIGKGKTDSEGFAMIDYKGGIPFAIVAKDGSDKGYLKITANQSLSVSNFDVSGQQVQKGLKGYIYGERGVWRPGDSIYVTFIMEDREQRIPKEHPASLELYTPTGQLYRTYISTNKGDGFYPFRMATNEDVTTGNWMANVKIGGAQFSERLRIETVKPNRLKVRLKTNDIVMASQGTLTCTLSSQWLHGAPAANLKASVEMTLSKANIPFKGYEEYVFNDPTTTFTKDTYTIFDGTLNSDGEAYIKTSLPQAENAPGMLRANFISRVFESGGDASIYTQSVPYSPYSSYIGLKLPKTNNGRWLETDASYDLDIVTIQPNGKPIEKNNLNVKIYKLEWSWWWNNDRNNLSSYINNSSAEVVLNKNFSTQGGKAKVSFKISYPDWGRYLVLVTDSNGEHKTGDIIYVDWPSYRGRSDKTDAQGLTMLSFSTNKSKYEVGEEVTVILPKSSDGRALISIEDGSRIISKTWVKTSATEDTKHTFKVTKEMAPNFYIFASLFQPHGQTSNDLPVRMYGVLNIEVEDKETVLNPIIEMPNELRPEKEYTVAVSELNKKEMTYTLAVVDEGLLDLTAFKTPNAWSDFYARQALGVRTWDMYDYIIGSYAGKMGPLLSIGGDEALKSTDESMKRFKPVVQYVGPFKLDKGKTNKHILKMPAYYGSVRAMVVAGSQDGAYGSSEKTVAVNNPLMVISTLPRVAGPDEEILLPVNVFAMNDNVKNVDVSVKSSGIFEFVGSNSQKVNFTGKGDKTIYFKVKVANKIGHERVEILAKGNGETASETIDIEIRNPNPPILLSTDALVEAGQSSNLNLKVQSVSKNDWVKLGISRIPGLDLNRSLKYLMDYPHGCSEQVTSRAFPLLYVDKFKTFTTAEKERMRSNVITAINIITSRQLANGGIAYWSGDRYPNEWVTTYATHFLIEAERAGYNVPASVKTKALNNLVLACQQWTGKPLYSSYYQLSMSSLQQAYRLYVLALTNKPELAAMNRLKESSDLSMQARWRLAAAYAIAGRKDAAKEIISKANTAITPYDFSNDTYGSYDRDLAMIIETMVLMDDIKGAVRLAIKLSEQMNNASYLTTQTSAYSLIALSKLADKIGTSPIMFEWELNGVKQKTDKTNKVYYEIDIDPQTDINIKITNIGDGIIYTNLTEMTQPLVDIYPAKNAGLALDIKYIDEKGSPIDITSLKQGTEFYAMTTVKNTTGRYLSDLVLNQIFPSGWEIFNTRLFDDGGKKVGYFNHQDIRDDRVYTYFNLGAANSTTIKIRLQAAYCGKFYMPAVTAEAMYNPADQSKTTGKWVEVVK